MATNRHALIRYRVIDECLRRKERTYHLKDLIEECSNAISKHENREIDVKRRTLLYDLKFLKNDVSGFNAPIAHDRTDGYYYTTSNFSIFSIPIKQKDIDVLRTALTDLKRISGKAGFKDLDSVITRLEEAYNIKRSRNTKPIVQFEHSTNIEGQKHLELLKRYIKDNQSLAIVYEPFDKPAYLRKVSPYLLKEYNNRWFLICFEYDQDWSITTLGLDRIKKIDKSLRLFHEHPDFDPDTYLKDVVGVSVNEDEIKTKIKFKAYGRQRHYINTKPIHLSQELIKMKKDHAIFTIDVIPNKELESKFLAYAEGVEVLKPKAFRKEVEKRIKAAEKLYRQARLRQ